MWKFLSPSGPLVFPGPIFMNQREQALARIRPLQALRHKRDKHKGTMVFTNSTGAETPLWLISQSGCPAHTSSLTLWPQVSYVVETSLGNRWRSLLTKKVTVEELLEFYSDRLKTTYRLVPFDMFLIYAMHVVVIGYIKVQVYLLRSVVRSLKVSPPYSCK